MRIGRALAVGIALVAVAAAAFALRAVGAEHVFPVGGPTVFEIGDGAYHARLARWALAHFPSFLTWDSYLNAPLGGPVPWPPLFDLGVAAAARALGGGDLALERALAWSAPLLAAATTFPIYAAARMVAGRGVAVGAAAIHGLFGPSLAYGAVGNGDHHAAVAFCGACLLAAALALAREDARGPRLVAIAVALALARAAVVLVWNGSLLFLAVCDGLLLLLLAVWGRRDGLLAEAASLAATAALAAPVLLAWQEVLGGPWSAVAPSRLHLLVLGAGAGVAAAVAAAEALRPASGPVRRVARLAAALGVASLGALAIPGLRAALIQVLGWLTLQDTTGAVTAEQLPLLPLGGRLPAAPPVTFFGWLTWLVPLAPALPLAAVPTGVRRPAAWLLAAWSTPLVLLALGQMRYANELGPALAICFALGFGRVGALLRTHLRVGAGAASAVVAVAAALLLGPPAAQGPLRQLGRSLAAWRGEHRPAASAVETPAGSLAVFGAEVRRATPETRGFLGDGEPEYTVLCNWNVGHAIRWYARRPTPVDPFWEYVDPENFARVERLFALEDEGEIVAAAAELRARYLLTSAAAAQNFPLEQRLHGGDGLGAGGRLELERFRLVTEGPAGGRPLSDLFGMARPVQVIPYKLFEIVEGARLEVSAPPGSEVQASTRVATPIGRGFDVRASARAGPDGVARLRLPYATRTDAPAHPLGPWRVRAGGREHAVDLDDTQVRRGEVLRLGP